MDTVVQLRAITDGARDVLGIEEDRVLEVVRIRLDNSMREYKKAKNEEKKAVSCKGGTV